VEEGVDLDDFETLSVSVLIKDLEISLKDAGKIETKRAPEGFVASVTPDGVVVMEKK
jgi:hypothetical protein